ncbi:MAG: 1-acyl-sn-glycerol-3-phosphate acyltransferase [Actinomycetota bacterium]
MGGIVVSGAGHARVAPPRRPYDDTFDPVSAARWQGVLRASVMRYFRPTVIGGENLPAGPGMIVGCHSGVIPYDAACLFVAIHDATGRYARFIGDDMFGRLAPVERFLRKQGAVVGRPERLEQLLEDGNLVLEFPGGALDMTRSYLTHRYQVLPHRGFAPGRGGYIKIALRTATPIVPLAVVGAEEAHVLIHNIDPVARLVRFPVVPLVVFPVPLPTKFYIHFGRPIRLKGRPQDANDQNKVDRLNRMVRRRIQTLIDDTRAHRHGVIVSRYV